MEITTTCRRYDMEPEVKDLAERRINKFERYFDQIQEAHLVLAQEKYRSIAELSVHGAGLDVMSREEQKNNMAAAVDRVCDRIERQLKKHNSRIKRRTTARQTVPPESIIHEDDLPEIEVEEEFSPVVVRSSHRAPAPMTVEEAIHLMREKDWDQLLFHDSRSDRMAMLFHRADGNYGLVEAE